MGTYGLYIRLFFRLRSQNNKTLPKKGPYLLLANHCNNLDGLFLQCLINRHIYFVVTDAMYKKKVLAKLLALVGYIPKRKHVTDSNAIRQVIRTVKNGGIVGIFPEGGRNWDGKTGDISPATFRLAELLRVPVVTACIKGSYLSEPRWAETKRRGMIDIDFKIHFADGKIPKLKQVNQVISSALTHNEAVWQKQKLIPFKGKALIRGLDRLLYTCPSCARIGTMDSSDDLLTCLSCGAAYWLDHFGYIHSSNGALPADNLPDMNEWQVKLLTTRLINADPKSILLTDEGASLYIAKAPNKPFEILAKGALLLMLDKLIIGDHEFVISKLHGTSVYFKTHLEFRYDGLDYRIGFDEKRVSAYKWNCALEAIKNV